MTKNYKAVLKSSLVMLVLFAVAGSGVAYAQECKARASGANTVRAEGVTEAVGGVELSCRAVEPDAFFPEPDETFTVSIELNTTITNEPDDDMVEGLTYTAGTLALLTPTLFGRVMIGKYSTTAPRSSGNSTMTRSVSLSTPTVTLCRSR